MEQYEFRACNPPDSPQNRFREQTGMDATNLLFIDPDDLRRFDQWLDSELDALVQRYPGWPAIVNKKALLEMREPEN